MQCVYSRSVWLVSFPLHTSVGDEVYFSGNCFRQGTNAECTAVDERLVAKKPTSLTFEEAAAFPLVAITGWENLVESMGVDKKSKTVLILGGAGGCGSFGIQLAKVFRCTVVATASTLESKAWCEKLGADHVIAHKVQGSHSEDHSDSRTLKEELAAIGLTRGVDGAYVCHDDRRYAAEVAEVLSPMGTVCPVVPFVPSEETLMGMYMNRQSIMFGMMFCRSIHGLECERQGQLLQRVAELIDAGQVKPIRCVGEVLQGLNAANVAKAHAMQESGHTRGKIVIACS
eukprot:g5375.t1